MMVYNYIVAVLYLYVNTYNLRMKRTVYRLRIKLEIKLDRKSFLFIRNDNF